MVTGQAGTGGATITPVPAPTGSAGGPPATAAAESLAIPDAPGADEGRRAAGAPSGDPGDPTAVPRSEDRTGVARRDRRSAVAAALVFVAALFVFLTPWPLDAKLRLVGAACCAQAPARTLHIGGSPMPLDARDAGIYLAGLLAVGMALLTGRARSGRFPPALIATLLAGLFAAMLLDGMTSSLQARGLRHLYGDGNALRAITGAGAGLALAMLGVPVVNRVLWRRPGEDAFAASYGELGGYVVAAAVLVALLLSPRPWLYYPLSILATLGVLVGWGLINSMVVAVATRRERRAVTAGDGGLILLAGVVLTLCEIAAIDWVRIATSR